MVDNQLATVTAMANKELRSQSIATNWMPQHQVSTMPAGAGAHNVSLSVHVCGRLVQVPPDAAVSLALLGRHLAAQLKLSGHGCFQFSDVSGNAIQGEEDMAAALREGRHPFQAALTVAALRDIEQKKSEVETKKEELTQFQWKVVVDQIAALSSQVVAVAGQLQAVKDECKQGLQHIREEMTMQHNRMEETIKRETHQREVGMKDAELKVDRVAQAVCAERSAREVATHQLSAQQEQAARVADEQRNVRSQEKAAMQRAVDGLKHQMEALKARSEEKFSQQFETEKRVDLRLEELGSADAVQVQRLQGLEADAERLRASVAATEATMSGQGRMMQELNQRRSEELSKAVRDEMVGRENHIARFAAELETSWRSLEVKMQRCKDESATAASSLMERARILEQRCAILEHDLQTGFQAQKDSEHALVHKVCTAANAVDTIELSLKSTDVIAQSTAVKVEGMYERLVAIEGDVQQKVGGDYWQHQMDALLRTDQKIELKLLSLEKEMQARFTQESAQREGVMAQMHNNVKTCLDKIVSTKPSRESSRFVEVTPSDEGSCPTPRCSFQALHPGGSPMHSGSPVVQRGAVQLQLAGGAEKAAWQGNVGGSMQRSYSPVHPPAYMQHTPGTSVRIRAGSPRPYQVGAVISPHSNP